MQKKTPMTTGKVAERTNIVMDEKREIIVQSHSQYCTQGSKHIPQGTKSYYISVNIS